MMLKEFSVSYVLKTLYLFLFPFYLFSSSTKSSLLQGSCGVYYDHDGTPNMLSVIPIVLGQ